MTTTVSAPVPPMRSLSPAPTPGSVADLRAVLALMAMPPRRVLLATLAGSAAAGSAIALIGVSAWLISRAWQMPPVLELSIAVVAVRALGISRGVFRYLERLLSHDVALRGLGRLREQVYQRLAEDTTGQADRLRRGEILARFDADCDRVSQVMVRGVLPFAVAAFTGVCAVVASALIVPLAGASLAVALLLAGLVGPWWSARTAFAWHREEVNARAAVGAELFTSLQARDELVVAGVIANQHHRIALAEHRLAAAREKIAARSAVASALFFLALGLAVGVAFVAGSTQVNEGSLAPVMLAVVCLLPLAALEMCAGLPLAAAEIATGAHAAARLRDVLPRAASPTGATTATPTGATKDAGSHHLPPLVAPAEAVHAAEPTLGAERSAREGIHATGLAVGWNTALPGLPHSLAVEPGAVVVLSGPNGCGKTTLALALAGLHAPLAGQVSWDGAPAHSPSLCLDSESQPLLVHYTAADAHIFATTVRENLLVAAATDSHSDQALLAALDEVGLTNWITQLPQGLDTVLTSEATTISGGQRRRLLVARSLLTQARYLIIDEPTEHLDRLGTAQFYQMIARLAREHDKGILLITHDEVPADLEATVIACGKR